MNTIVVSEERLAAEPLLAPCLRAVFPECRIVVANPEERLPKPARGSTGPTRELRKGTPAGRP